MILAIIQIHILKHDPEKCEAVFRQRRARNDPTAINDDQGQAEQRFNYSNSFSGATVMR
jgi:hypothetical protein